MDRETRDYEIDRIQEDVLGFCTCGDPESSLKFLRNSLRIVKKLTDEVHADKISYKSWNKQVKSLFRNNGAKYFMWYFLEKLGFAEHGNCVPGWLTDKGEDFLKKLESLKL